MNSERRKNIIYLIFTSIAIKFIYFLFAVLISKSSFRNQSSSNEISFIHLFKKNDSYWYQKAAETGYPKITNPLDLGWSKGEHFKQSVWAHFPLYPISIRLLEKSMGLDFSQSAFILSLIFSTLSFIAFYLICINLFKRTEKESLFFTLFFILFPFHYYYSMYYTEALFFILLAFSFLSIYYKKYWLTGLLIIPLSLVRPNGIACVLPLFIYYIEIEGGFKELILQLKPKNWKKYLSVLWFITAPIALGIYCLYQKQMTDHYFAFVKAQAGWYKEFMFPLLALFRRSDFTTQFNSIYTILIMLICIGLWKKFPLSLNLLIWISILLPMASGSVACMPRYISVVFPLSVYFASVLIKPKRQFVVLSIVFILQLLTFYTWVIDHPFSL